MVHGGRLTLAFDFGGWPTFIYADTITTRLPHLSRFSKEPALSLVEGCAFRQPMAPDFPFMRSVGGRTRASVPTLAEVAGYAFRG